MNGVDLWVEFDGPSEAPVVVFLHGALASGAAFRSQRVALRERFRLVFVDLRGHGRATHLGGEVGWESLTYAMMTCDVHELLGALSLDRVHLVGASMGGALAARVTAERPERVASLALLGTGAGGRRRAYFEGLTPEALPVGTQRLSALWHGEPYWRELARHLFAQVARQAEEAYPLSLRPPRALVMQATEDDILDPDEAQVWVARMDAPTVLVAPPGDHAFFADGRGGSQAANAALREHLLASTRES